jgi:hypothetical protein
MGRMIEYRAVVRVLGEERSAVLGAFRAAGGSADRWKRPDQEAMCDALTRGEDRLEGARGSHAELERAAIRGVRRRLELELFP